MIDYSDYTDMIPPKTIAIVQMRVRPGDGTDGVLKRTKAGDGEYLDTEFVVLEGPYAKRKIFASILLLGTTEGQKQMCERNGALLKQIIDSAKYLDPNDKLAEARKARTVNYRDFNFRFLAEIGAEQGRNGYSDKNVITRAITKDKPEWSGRPPIDQVAPDYVPPGGAAAGSTAGQEAATATPIAKPSWA
jgi:hypothetical protein